MQAKAHTNTNGGAAMLYTPRTLTLLAVVLGCIGYFAHVLEGSAAQTDEQRQANMRAGIHAVAAVFLG